MQIIIIFLIWYFAFGKDNPKFGKDAESKIGFVIVAFIALFALGGVFTVISILFSLFGILLSMGIPIMILMAMYKLLVKDKKSGKSSLDIFGKENESPKVGKSHLAKEPSKRKKIISKFNKKYKLCLDEKEIDRICEASYVSYGWEQEVVAMSRDYSSVSEWYAGSTGWLRVYLRVFSVQSISSDFELQRKICMDSFAQVFDSINMKKYVDIDACIEEVNSRFYTNFDETTFMLAYRFMEANGRSYKLPEFGVSQYESEIDKLKRKYDDEGASGVSYESDNRVKLR